MNPLWHFFAIGQIVIVVNEYWTGNLVTLVQLRFWGPSFVKYIFKCDIIGSAKIFSNLIVIL